MASLENFRLVVFRAVAGQLSFRKAAEELYLTQPAVSLQIKALEEDLGVQLFDRGGAHIALTAAGEALLRYTVQSHALLAEAEQEIAALTGGQGGELALGASTTIAQYVLPRRLSEFRRLHPRVHLTLVSGNTEEIVAAIEAHRIALGMIEGPARSREVKTEPFLADELVLLIPGGHEWAERDEVGCGEMASMPLLMRERGSGTRRIIELALEKQCIKLGSLQIVMELDSTEAIKSAVEAGLGAGFVSRWALARDARMGNAFKAVAIKGLRIQREFLIAHHASQELQGAAEEFRRLLLHPSKKLG
jgi:DNA-binding transcriptional LysR family regulator